MREYLKQYRQAAGLRKHEVAQRIEMTPANYGFIESGHHKKLTADMVAKIAEVVGVPANELFEKEVDYIASCV